MAFAAIKYQLKPFILNTHLIEALGYIKKGK